MRSSRRVFVVAMALVGTALLAGCTAGPPEDVECDAEKAGNRISWSPAENATSYGVYRAEGDGAFSQIANVTATEYLDTNATKGATYRYHVTSFYRADVNQTSEEFIFGESAPSEECEVTTIPFFPALWIAAVAIVGGAVAYVAMRRRKA